MIPTRTCNVRDHPKFIEVVFRQKMDKTNFLILRADPNSSILCSASLSADVFILSETEELVACDSFPSLPSPTFFGTKQENIKNEERRHSKISSACVGGKRGKSGEEENQSISDSINHSKMYLGSPATGRFSCGLYATLEIFPSLHFHPSISKMRFRLHPFLLLFLLLFSFHVRFGSS